MRAAPPVTVTLDRPRCALAALIALAGVALVASAAWAWSRRDAVGFAVMSAVALHAVWTLGAALRRRPLSLRWDGTRWLLADGPTAERRPGTLAVSLDLGAFLLLRFRADAAVRRRTRWLPAERADHPGDWHALRCAVYSPHPTAAVAVPDAPPRP